MNALRKMSNDDLAAALATPTLPPDALTFNDFKYLAWRLDLISEALLRLRDGAA